MNNPVSSVDYQGTDAILLQDKDAVYSAGHTGLLLQDDEGQWWHFYWGNNREGKLGKSGSGEMLTKYVGNTNLSAINSFYSSKYNGNEYEDMIYFEGDFSASVDYAKKLQKEQPTYNLIINNCMQVSTDVLRKGEFKQNNDQYKYTLLKCRFSIIPNVAYRTIKNSINKTNSGYSGIYIGVLLSSLFIF